jgi:hypothetical protein
MDINEIIKQLKYNSDPQERRNAAELLIANKTYSNESLNALILGLLDFDNGVKDICARGLLSMPKELQYQAALNTSTFIKNKNIEIRNLAADILLHLGDRALDVLINFFSDEDPDNRKFACDIVGRIQNRKSIPYIVLLLDDDNINVVASAIEALGNLKDNTSVYKLCEMYDKNDEIRPDIIESLGKIGGDRAQKFLIKILNDETDMFLKTLCVDALSQSSVDITLCDYLYKELPSVSQELQLIFLKTIYSIYFRLDMEFQIPDKLRHIANLALMDDDENIRMAGLLALGKSYRKEDIECLLAEIIRNDNDTQLLIMSNLLLSSTHEIMAELFDAFFKYKESKEIGLDFMTNMPQVLIQLPKQDITLIINIILECVFKYSCYDTMKTIEVLADYDRQAVAQKLQYIIANNENNIQNIDYIIEIVTVQHFDELLPDLEKIITNNIDLPNKTKDIISGLY